MRGLLGPHLTSSGECRPQNNGLGRSAKLAELQRVTRAEDVGLRLARVKPDVRAVLEADGVLEQIGLDRVHGNVQRAVRTELEGHPLDSSD